MTGFHTDNASALALGRITVQSALGEPLRAEIDLPQITAAEADSLRATTASAEVFRAQGMELTPAVNNLRMQLERRADGTAVLRLYSDRPVNDPFVDLVLDASWNSGHILRSYTMLLDPPALRRVAPTAAATPVVTAMPRAAAPASAPVTPTQASAAPPAPSAAAPAATRARRPAPAASPAPAKPAPPQGMTVQAGDTASRLANTHRPSGVSLDQMLVAMLRANPDAFIRGNINRIKAGAVLQMPDETAAQATSTPEARQILAAQSRDFNVFRRKLAGIAPTTDIATADRTASGAVQTRVEDKKPATSAPDKLTLSKGSVANQKSAEEQLAKEKQTSESSARIAELSKNISDLNKLNTASAPVKPPAAAPSASEAIAVTTPAAALPAQPAASAPVAATLPAASAATEPVATASAPAVPEPAATPASEPVPAAAPAPAPVPAPTPTPEEPNFFDGLMEDPLLPAGGLLALLVLGGYGAYRIMQRRRQNGSDNLDSSFLESRLQPDSFFGASGGQQVDTANTENGEGASMTYSPSQLDAGGDVDPVAEADVYLAYGRDLQAEEILREAARNNPARVSVHVKLAEIYTKRQDRKALEAVANDVFKLTQGEGPDWARVAELGNSLDPENPLYQPGVHQDESHDDDLATAPDVLSPPVMEAAEPDASASTLPHSLDFDLDLELDSFPEEQKTEAPAAPGGFAAAVAAADETSTASVNAEAEAAAALPSLDLPPPLPSEPPSVMEPPAVEPPPMVDLDFSLPADSLTLPPPAATPQVSATAADEQDMMAPMEFDLGDLTLDLGTPSTSGAPPAAPEAAGSANDDAEDDPLATKLALAQEFDAIGDTDGARSLIEEVIAESSGALKARAQRMLANLN